MRYKSGDVRPVPGSGHEVQRLEYGLEVDSETSLVAPLVRAIDANTGEVLKVYLDHEGGSGGGEPGPQGPPGPGLSVGEGEPDYEGEVGEVYLDAASGDVWEYVA